MRRRTKRRLIVAGVLSALFVVGYVFLWPKDLRPKLNAFGSRWAVEDLEWKPLFDHYAMSFNLSLNNGLGEVQATPADLATLCDAVLDALPNPPTARIRRSDVYRVTFNVKNQRTFVFDEDIDIGVIDGICQQRVPDQAFAHTYPAPMNDWALRTDLDVSLTAGDAPEYSFKWEGAGEADLETFPFEAACTAVITDPPDILARAPDQLPTNVTIWAEKQIGESGSGQFTAVTRLFEIADGICVEAESQ